MIDHTAIGAASVKKSAFFYDAILFNLGHRRVAHMSEDVGTHGIGYGVEYPILWIDYFHTHSVGVARIKWSLFLSCRRLFRQDFKIDWT